MCRASCSPWPRGWIALLAVVTALASPAGAQKTPAEPLLPSKPLAAWLQDLKDVNPLVREEALEVLGQAGLSADRVADAVRPLLRDPVVTTRVRAALVLWRVEQKPDPVLPVLIEAARDSGRQVRLLVLEGIQAINPASKEAAQLFIECLGDSDTAIRAPAHQGLLRMPPEGTVPALAQGLEHKNPEVVRQCLQLLHNMGPRALEGAGAVRKLLRHSDVRLRLSAAQALWYIARDGESVVAPLLEIAQGAEPSTRYLAIQSLLPIRPTPREAIPVYERYLKETIDPLTRVRIADALWAFDGRSKDLIPVLLEGLRQEGNFSARYQARLTLAQMKPAAKEIIPATVALARSAPPGGSLAGDLAHILGQMGEEAVAVLEPLLQEKEPHLRRLAISALVQTGSKGVKQLAGSFSKLDVTEKAQVLHLLSQPGVGEEVVVPLLVEALREGPEALFEPAMNGLAQIGQRAGPAVPMLVEMIKDDKRPAGVRSRVTLLLGSLGAAAKPAVPAILALVQDGKQPLPMRQQAVMSLGLIGPAASDAKAALRELLKGESASFRLKVLEALWQMHPGDLSILEPIQALFREDEARRLQLHSQASSLLGTFGPDARPLVPVLLQALREPGNSYTRGTIIETLGKIAEPNKEVLTLLREQLNDADLSYRIQVGNTLSLLGAREKEIATALSQALLNRALWNRWNALTGLQRLEAAAAPAIQDLLTVFRAEPPYSQDRYRIAEVLAIIDPRAAQETLPWLRGQINQSSPYLTARAGVIIARIDPKLPDGVPALLRLVRDRSIESRYFIIDQVGPLGPLMKEAIPELEAILKGTSTPQLPDSRPLPASYPLLLRVATARALLQIDPKKVEVVLPVFIEILKDDRYRTGTHRQSVIAALGGMGPAARDAVPALLDLYAFSEIYQRRAIVEALRRIEPKAIARLGK